MAKETIRCEGGNLTLYIPFIEELFTGPGCRLERIQKDFIEVRIKRYYPRKLLNEKIKKLETKLKEDGKL